MKDADVVKLAAAFLEEAASHGAGPFEDRPAFNGLRDAVRPKRVPQPPADPRPSGFVPSAFGAPAEATPLTSQDHAANIAEVSFEGDKVVEKQLFS